jgi:4'-phosphopantetheinyl transferase
MHWPLSVAERQALDALEGSARDESFYRFWTLKEAFIKGLGIGVSLPGEDFDMSPSHLGEPRLLRLAGAPGEPARWRFAEFVPARGYRAAVAALTEGRDLVANWHASCLTRAI